MVSAIDPAQPADSVAAVKSDRRANLQATRTEIEALLTDSADVHRQHALADFADTGAMAGLDQVGSGEIAPGALDRRAPDMSPGGGPSAIYAAAAGVDVLAFVTRNGGATTWFGFPGGQASS